MIPGGIGDRETPAAKQPKQERVNMKDPIQLSSSGWTALSVTPGRSLWLEYRGTALKRSQNVVRYHDGTDGYEWPEDVPKAVKAKVAKLLDSAT